MVAGMQGPVRIYIRDHLGADQVSEEVRVMIDSREAGKFSLDQQHTASVLPVEVAGAGEHSYVLEVSTTVRKDSGPTEKKRYVGQGTFMASPDKIFRLAGDRKNGWLVHLEADEDEAEIDE